jgi:hypothetical protein
LFCYLLTHFIFLLYRWVAGLPDGRVVAITITDTAIAAKRPPGKELYSALGQLGANPNMVYSKDEDNPHTHTHTQHSHLRHRKYRRGFEVFPGNKDEDDPHTHTHTTLTSKTSKIQKRSFCAVKVLFEATAFNCFTIRRRRVDSRRRYH